MLSLAFKQLFKLFIIGNLVEKTRVLMHEVCHGLSKFASLLIIIRHNAWQEAHASPILLFIIIYSSEKINLFLLHLFV